MLILAHRGWWVRPTEKNTLEAFHRAFSAGYGVETDVRDHDGRLVIEHDLPTGGSHIDTEDVFELYVKAGQPAALAINIKADGLHELLSAALSEAGVANAFVFDMAVPDARGYIVRQIPAFTRHSELEPSPAFYGAADGVWMDCFDGDWITEEAIGAHRGAGKRVALVSPELHGRDYMGAWTNWRGLHRDDGVMICTDFPQAANEFFHRLDAGRGR